MLKITIPGGELWDESKGEFVYREDQTLVLEHSLISLAKWESKWCKAFLSNKEKTREETIDYVKCMTLTQNVNPEVYDYLTNENIREINEYIAAPMTAAYFAEDKTARHSREPVIAELIYYWMISLNIPVQFEKWHLNRLLSLIKVCNLKNQPPKKRSAREIMKRNAELNAARRKKLNTKG